MYFNAASLSFLVFEYCKHWYLSAILETLIISVLFQMVVPVEMEALVEMVEMAVSFPSFVHNTLFWSSLLPVFS